jgi:biopolymer transport protein TolR
MAEINVTPFVDVMLVLLVVFIIAAPLLSVGIEVNLPRTQAGALPAGRETPVWVTIKADGTFYVQETETNPQSLEAQLEAILSEGAATRRLLVRADAEVPHGRVAEVLAIAQKAGFTNVGLAAEPSK